MYQYVPVVNGMYLVHTSTYFEVKVHVGMYLVHLGAMQFMSVLYHSIVVHGKYLYVLGTYNLSGFQMKFTSYYNLLCPYYML